MLLANLLYLNAECLKTIFNVWKLSANIWDQCCPKLPTPSWLHSEQTLYYREANIGQSPGPDFKLDALWASWLRVFSTQAGWPTPPSPSHASASDEWACSLIRWVCVLDGVKLSHTNQCIAMEGDGDSLSTISSIWGLSPCEDFTTGKVSFLLFTLRKEIVRLERAYVSKYKRLCVQLHCSH